MLYMRELLQYVRPQWRRLALGVFMGALGAAFNAVVLISFQVIFSIVLKGGAQATMGMTRRVPLLGRLDIAKLFGTDHDTPIGIWGVIIACSCIPALIFARGFLGFLSARIYTSASCHILYQIRNDLYRAILRQSLSFFNKSKAGELIQIISNHSTSLQVNSLALVQAVTKHPLTIISILAVLFSMDWFFTLMSLFVFPLCLIPLALIAKHARRSGQIEQQATGDMLVCMHEAIGGIRVVKCNSREDYEHEKFERANATISIDAIKFNKAAELSGPLVETVASLGIAGGLVYWWAQGRTADEFFLLVMALTQMYPPLKELSRIGLTMQKTVIATNSVFELLKRVPDVADAGDAVVVGRASGQVQFNGISFSYCNAEGARLQRQAIANASVTFETGKFYALVGPSGAGKSTLFSLLMRFYDVDEGAVLIDGRDIRSITQKSLRDNVAVVSQDVFLFHDTVRQNIRYGRLDATDQEIEQAGRDAHVEEFVSQMPHGYDSVVGDGGSNLSGGQKQRISIARAILRNAPILLLDEATSALDTESERVIQDAICHLAKGRTVIAIAHRLSTVLAAHKIVVMRDGMIEAVGSHQELLEKSELYQRLYQLQFNVEEILPVEA